VTPPATPNNNKPDANEKINDTVEAGLNWWKDQNGDARWEENGQRDLDPEGNLCFGCGYLSGPVADTNFTDAFYASGPTKDNCLWIRVHVGNLPPDGTGGGFLEWSTDGVNFTGLTSRSGSFGPVPDTTTAVGGVLLDSRAPGYNPPQNDWDEDLNNAGHRQAPGVASPLYIALGAGNIAGRTGSMYFDDFVVQTSLTPPNATDEAVWHIYN
jgi:hypothetical protein